MKVETLKVEGMTCGHCASSVKKAIESLGASGEVDLAGKQVTVEYDELKLSHETIKAAIEEQGYNVV